ncbi:hypothetical protein SERLADRAFT_444353 [Serpula lacrymans var. lacrymans S7.9]|uniref:Uncharacterized protein n=1 Tax=Serpula lacrymans var. lacrymans (strain S7.9) TaxID=578457 RepID=F8NDW2_SERL9|nr:uncharacterized protein SERLADRAFT_444353 [Serpula lacrymans var. lacrymans S7.9]EGO30436.1 hypothetical protein SERLADRAFT_444353 [Serpula lacrymans var. lacrymans S7.9]
MRELHLVPVLLGRPLPRPDRDGEEFDNWSRAMLILFKPWRRPSDLRSTNESWTEAFQRYDFSPKHKTLMANMNVENECKDTRDLHSHVRRTNPHQPELFTAMDGMQHSDDIEGPGFSVLNGPSLQTMGSNGKQ